MAWHTEIVGRLGACGLSRSAVARGASVTLPNLQRYAATGKGLSARSIERLAVSLGLDLKSCDTRPTHTESTQSESTHTEVVKVSSTPPRTATPPWERPEYLAKKAEKTVSRPKVDQPYQGPVKSLRRG